MGIIKNIKATLLEKRNSADAEKLTQQTTGSSEDGGIAWVGKKNGRFEVTISCAISGNSSFNTETKRYESNEKIAYDSRHDALEKIASKKPETSIDHKRNERSARFSVSESDFKDFLKANAPTSHDAHLAKNVISTALDNGANAPSTTNSPPTSPLSSQVNIELQQILAIRKGTDKPATPPRPTADSIATARARSNTAPSLTPPEKLRKPTPAPRGSFQNNAASTSERRFS